MNLCVRYTVVHPVLVVGVRDVIGGVVGMVVGGVVGGRAGAGIRDVTGGVAPRCWEWVLDGQAEG